MEQNLTSEVYLKMLESSVDPLITEFVEANPNAFKMAIHIERELGLDHHETG